MDHLLWLQLMTAVTAAQGDLVVPRFCLSKLSGWVDHQIGSC